MCSGANVQLDPSQPRVAERHALVIGQRVGDPVAEGLGEALFEHPDLLAQAVVVRLWFSASARSDAAVTRALAIPVAGGRVRGAEGAQLEVGA